MHNQKPLKLLFVVNPVSGGKEKHDWEASIRDHFRNLPHSIEFYLLTGKDDRTSVEHHIRTIRPHRVVAVGGDGTVKMLAGLLQGTSLPLGILPAGSANGMARELEIPTDAKAALEVLTGGWCKKLDLIRINDTDICLHLSDMGLNAMLVKYFERSGKRGMWGYGQAVFRVLWEKQIIKATIKTDSGEVLRRVYMVVIANAKTYGTGAIINPAGKVDDGVFEVVIVRRLSLSELFKMLITHQPFNPECIEVFQTKSLEITTKRKAYFQVDGEFLGKTNAIRAQILPQSIEVVVPRAGAGGTKIS